MVNNRRTRTNRRRRTQSRNDGKMANLLQGIKDATSMDVDGVPPTVPDIPRTILSRNRPVNIVRSYQSNNIIVNTSPTDQYFAIAVRLSDMPNSSELTTSFDRYRCMSVEITFSPTSASNFTGPLFTVIDYDTSSPPSSVNDIFQYNSLQITAASHLCVRRFTPRSASATYGGAFTNYGLDVHKWIACDSSGVFFYGLRGALQGVTGQSANLIAYQVYVKAHWQFCDPR